MSDACIIELACCYAILLPYLPKKASNSVFLLAYFLAACEVTPEGYAHMTHLLSSLANGRIVVALEGGYNLTSIAYSMTLCTKALLGDPIPPLLLKENVDPVAVESIRNVLNTHSEFWSCLKPFRKQFPFSTELVPVGKYSEVGDIKCLAESLQTLNIANNNNNLSLSSQDNNNFEENRSALLKMDKDNNQPTADVSAEQGAVGGATTNCEEMIKTIHSMQADVNVQVSHKDYFYWGIIFLFLSINT